MFIIPIAKSFLFIIYWIMLFGMDWNKFLTNNVFYLLQEIIISKYNFLIYYNPMQNCLFYYGT